MNIQITRDNLFDDSSQWNSNGDEIQSGIMMPPPLDDLDGLEVVIGNSFTQGYIRPIPSKRLKNGEQLFEVEQWSMFQDDGGNGSTMGFIDSSSGEVTDDNKEEFSLIQNYDEFSVEDIDQNSSDSDDDDEDLDAAIESARIAAEEAKRKAEKLEMLKQRAEEAKQRRKEAKMTEDEKKMNTESKSSGLDKEKEAQRKAEKMEVLKRRAEEALARRRDKKISE